MLLKGGADHTLKNGQGRTPLHCAIARGHQGCCELLIAHGADPHAVDEDGNPPLYHLHVQLDEDMATFLAYAGSIGIDLHATLPGGGNLYWRLGHSRAAVHYLAGLGLGAVPPPDAYTGDLPQDLMTAVRHHDVPKIQVLIGAGFDLDTPVPASEWADPEPPILVAVYQDHLDVVELLLDAGCNVNAHRDNLTLLHMAAREGSVDMIDLLLKRGANPNAIVKIYDPLLKALDRGHLAAAERLLPYWTPDRARLEKAQSSLSFMIKHRNLDEAGPMLRMVEQRLDDLVDDKERFAVAVQKADTAAVAMLLARGVDPDLVIAEPGVYAIHYAIEKRKVEVVRLLIEGGANLDQRTPRVDDYGFKTPLHLAVDCGRPEVLEMLLKAGADHSCKGAFGRTPLFDAITKRDTPACKMLVAHGAALDTVDRDGKPPLFSLLTGAPRHKIPAFLKFAASIGQDLHAKLDSGENLYWYLGGIKCAVDYLEKLGIRASAPAGAYTGELPRDLMTAVAHHDVDKIAELAKAGFDLDTPAPLSWYSPQPPILLAADNDFLDVVELLLDAGASVNAARSDNRSLLHAAASNGSIDLISLLLSRGADPNAIRDTGDSAYQENDDPMLCAVNCGHIAAAELLLPLWKPTRRRVEWAIECLQGDLKGKKLLEAQPLLAALHALLSDPGLA